MSLDKIADEIEKVIKDEGAEFLREQGDAWENFAKEIGKQIAKQAVKAKTGSESEKLEAKANLAFLEASLASRIAISELDFLGRGEKALEKVLRVGVRVLTAAL